MTIKPDTSSTPAPASAALTPAQWQHAVVRTADGAQLHYTRTGGAKPPLLLLHGLQAAGLIWLRTAQALEERFDVIMPDLRGHGASSRVAGPLSAGLLVDDIATLLNTLSVEHPAVVGHSLGADIAGRLAAERSLPALVLVDPALANISSALAFNSDNPPPWMASLFATLRSLASLPHAERLQAAHALLPPGTPAWHAADYDVFVEGLARFDLAFHRSIAAMGYVFEERELLNRIGSPTLLLTARPMRPDLGPPLGLAAFQHGLKRCEHVPFLNSGHFIMFDQFDQFIATLRPFLGTHS